MSAKEDREAFAAQYKLLLGRNTYSQSLRGYVFDKYKDGKYYSDCSSSVAKCYERIGMPINYLGSKLPNTVGMMQTKDLRDVELVIKNGIIQNPEALRVGDLLLFAGSDRSRAYAGYVGHVEAVYKIDGKKVTLCGHGSGVPRTTEMNAYCRSRYLASADTPIGNRGLICVRRRIEEDENIVPLISMQVRSVGSMLEVTGNTVNLRAGAGADTKKVGIVRKGDRLERVEETGGFVPVLQNNALCWISRRYVKEV